MDNNLDLIDFLRDVTIHAASRVEHNDDIVGDLSNRFRFQRREDWMRWGSCLYTYTDASMAIRGYFASFGNTHDSDFHYLRLFGFLSAVYLQLEAIASLAEISKVEGKKTILGRLKEHDLIQCRHMLASHTLSYKEGHELYSITIQQMSLSGTGVSFMKNETEEIMSYDFESLYCDWVKVTRDDLAAICRKIVATMYKPNPEKMVQCNRKLEAMLNES